MAGDRYLVLGLARARTAWFADVARWTTASRIPADFVKCVSAGEARARLEAVGMVSALLIDAGAPGVDRDLIAAARAGGSAVLVVEDGRAERDWPALGASAVLPRSFDAELLLDLLRRHASPIADRRGRAVAGELPDPAGFTAPLVAVCGVRGTGVSTVAMSLAQGLARRSDGRGSVLLADLCLDASLGAYHAATDVVPGVQELVEAHRTGRPDRSAVRAATFAVESRGYSLLQGLRRPRDWTALPFRAVDATLTSLLRSHRWVVADTTAEVDGEAETGSIDIEERNHLARATLRAATVVVVVGAPGVRAVWGTVRVLDDLHALGVAPDRVLPVVNRAPRSMGSRAEIVRALGDLCTAELTSTALFLPNRRGLDAVHHTVDLLPEQLVSPITTAVAAVAARATSPVRVSDVSAPILVTGVAS